MTTDWAMEEFGAADLGDKRLTRRLLKQATRFADKPTASIPGACLDRATVCAGPALGAIEFTLASRHGQAERTVRQAIRAQRVSLPDGAGGQLALTCVIARESAAPQGVKPIEWRH